MAYAKTDEHGRILAWSEYSLDGFDTEFSNGRYIDETCVNGLQDFVIRDGTAYFEPTEESTREVLRRKLEASADENIEMVLCELAEQQAEYERDVNAALCELYEMMERGGKNG